MTQSATVTNGHAVEFEGGHKIETVYVDPKNPKGAFKVRDYNATTREYSEFREFPTPRDPDGQKYIDELWNRYSKESRQMYAKRDE